jgi:hypothetical protein
MTCFSPSRPFNVGARRSINGFTCTCGGEWPFMTIWHLVLRPSIAACNALILDDGRGGLRDRTFRKLRRGAMTAVPCHVTARPSPTTELACRQGTIFANSGFVWARGKDVSRRFEIRPDAQD